MSTTRIALYRLLAEKLGRGKLEVIQGSASTNTSTTSLVDPTRLTYSSGDANAYDRVWVYAVTITDAVARGFSRVTQGGYTVATGALGLSPALSGLVTTDKYVLTREHPDTLHEAIDEVLRNDYYEALYPLSMHITQNDSNDMEPSSIATDWDVATGGAVLATHTTSFVHGIQSLSVNSNGTNGYAALKSVMGVHDGIQLYAGIDCNVKSGDDAAFRIWDVTNDAEIDSATTDEPSWTELTFQFTTPSGCEQIDARLEGIAANDFSYWDDFHIWQDGTGIYSLPSFVEDSSQLLDVIAYPQGEQGPAGDNDYRPLTRRSTPLDWWWESTDPGSMQIGVRCGSARPYLKVLRTRPELSAVTSTTLADPDWVVAMAEKVITDPERASEILAAHRAAQLAQPRIAEARRFGTTVR
jgi:hypothetical protein